MKALLKLTVVVGLVHGGYLALGAMGPYVTNTDCPACSGQGGHTVSDPGTTNAILNTYGVGPSKAPPMRVPCKHCNDSGIVTEKKAEDIRELMAKQGRHH